MHIDNPILEGIRLGRVVLSSRETSNTTLLSRRNFHSKDFFSHSFQSGAFALQSGRALIAAGLAG